MRIFFHINVTSFGIPEIPRILPMRTTISRNVLAADCVSKVITGFLGVFRSWRLFSRVFCFFRILTSSQVVSVQSSTDRLVRHKSQTGRRSGSHRLPLQAS